MELHKGWLVLKLMLSTGIIVDCVGNVVGIYNFGGDVLSGVWIYPMDDG